jgi:hypothetical protein
MYEQKLYGQVVIYEPIGRDVKMRGLRKWCKESIGGILIASTVLSSVVISIFHEKCNRVYERVEPGENYNSQGNLLCFEPSSEKNPKERQNGNSL